jgi:putative tributyrin esterase
MAGVPLRRATIGTLRVLLALLPPGLFVALCLLPALSVTAAPPVARSAAVVREARFWSGGLAREMPYRIYLPPGYESNPHQRYPVLYMLHGLGGSNGDWQGLGLFNKATELIEAGAVPPMLIVTPEGERGYWMDHANGGPRFGAYVADDLVSMVDRDYRTLDDRGARAIGGMSMGGHGALQLALNNPETFSIVGAHSVALRRQHEAFEFFGRGADYRARDPVSLCESKLAVAQRLVLWLDIGADDGWVGGTAAFRERLTSLGIAHQWRLYPGGHDGAYWSEHTGDYLRFYGDAFARWAR